MANSSLLDEKYDFALLGTSLPLSILSAALSRAGFSVLHIDDADYYGGPWASLTLKELINLTKTNRDDLRFDGLIDIDIKFPFVSDSDIPPELEAVNRHFAISLAPTLLPCSGPTIDVLVRSKVASYCTFRLLQKTAVYSNDGDEDSWPLQSVPSSKEDIFKDKSLSLVDKRRLMKLLQKAAPMQATTTEDESSSSSTITNTSTENFDQIQGNFLDYLTKSVEGPKFSQKLAKDVMYGVALCSSSKDSASLAMKRIQKHITSVGRYGNSAYLIGQYGGAGEMAQCFSRASAVQGGTFVLGHKVRQLESIEQQKDVEEKEEILPRWKIALDGIEGSCQAGCVVGDQDILHRIGKLSQSYIDNLKDKEGRSPRQALGIMLLDRGMSIQPPIKNASDQQTSIASPPPPPETALVIFPPNEDDDQAQSGSVWALQMGEGTFSCPKGTYLVYLCTALPQNAEKLHDAEQARKALSFAREGVLKLASASEPEWKSNNQTQPEPTSTSTIKPLFECYMVRETFDFHSIQQQSSKYKQFLHQEGLLPVPSSLENLVNSLDDATQQAEDIYWLLCGQDGVGRERAENLRKRQRRNVASSYTVGRGLAGIPDQEEGGEEGKENESKEDQVLDFFPISEDADES